jgi:ABC-type tungstate transport system substrate-binding protein
MKTKLVSTLAVAVALLVSVAIVTVAQGTPFKMPGRRAKNTLIQTTHRVAEPTIGVEWALWTMIAHPFWA